MEESVLVLGFRPYDFADKDTGRQVKGVSAYYVTGDQEEGVYGHAPQKAALPADAEKDIRAVPGIYKIGYAKRGRNLAAVSLKFVSEAAFDVREELNTAALVK